MNLDPAAPRAKVPMEQWAGKETGFYAYVIPVAPSTYAIKTDDQSTLDAYFCKK